MTKHTPGPWSATCEDVAGERRIGDDGVRFWTIEAPRGEGDIYRGCVAHVWASRLNGGLTIEERDSNARLIAAAPDLLAALQWFVEFCDEHQEWTETNLCNGRDDSAESLWLASARAAIAKAKGE